MEISVSEERGARPVTVMRINGPITESEKLVQRAREAFEAGARDILLDLTDVPYMSTQGLRALHAIYLMLRTDAPEEGDEAVRKGIAAGTFTSPHLKLLKPSKHVAEALKAAGYDMFLQIHTDRKRAIESFR